MTQQLQHLEMQPYIADLRLCHLTGNANLTVWYMTTVFFNDCTHSFTGNVFVIGAVQEFLILCFVASKSFS